eukprot:11199087-Lingulodinium_polyedra.AAC.1
MKLVADSIARDRAQWSSQSRKVASRGSLSGVCWITAGAQPRSELAKSRNIRRWKRSSRGAAWASWASARPATTRCAGTACAATEGEARNARQAGYMAQRLSQRLRPSKAS